MSLVSECQNLVKTCIDDLMLANDCATTDCMHANVHRLTFADTLSAVYDIHIAVCIYRVDKHFCSATWCVYLFVVVFFDNFDIKTVFKYWSNLFNQSVEQNYAQRVVA